jgi:protein-S-isoprenylcysteine O-methyltransferase Ste14
MRLWRVWLALAGEAVVFGLLLFGAAGTLRWPAAWAFLVLFWGAMGAITARLARDDPGLLAERMKLPIQRDQPVWDKMVMAALLPLFVAWLALMGLDAGRFHWSSMSSGFQLAGAAGILVSSWWIDRVFRENHYLIPVVRIQAERGHQVITTGPYAVVRHPLYASAFILLASSALLLGSWWGLAGTLVMIALFAVRTALEDRKLMRELAGYADYAARVRYRLVPFVW